MPEEREKQPDIFSTQVGVREKRKLTARRNKGGGGWSELGLFGVVGWSVSVPTVLGIFAGVWIDLKWPGPPSWTLMLLLLGIATGCVNAWFWISRQRHTINKERIDDAQ